MEFLIITGMSGAGKSQAANVLEDIGFYCIDNMPAKLIPEFANLYSSASRERDVAFIIDVRGENDFGNLFESIEALRKSGHTCKTVFIDCNDEVLVNRYKETRRVHPLVKQTSMSISSAIALEREMTAPLRERCDIVIDTTKTTLAQLRERVYAAIGKDGEKGIKISCMSFGFKYGQVNDADLVFDVRCFPNPFYIPELKHQTGLDADVYDFVFDSEQTRAFLEKLVDMLTFLLPLYKSEGKHQLTVAIGCTGGKHRSVAIAKALAERLIGAGYKADTFHRDINRE
ncbi:MAG: RNase adapter RapZ [Clostridia bacterium]|nr:RNase adapter RapZ [Clostridia bacterium]